MVVPQSVVGAVGRMFFRAVKRVPVLFPMLCSFGLAIGVGALFLFWEPVSSARETVIVRVIGVGMILFYGGLAGMFTVKSCRGTWQEFCDWGYGIFENM